MAETEPFVLDCSLSDEDGVHCFCPVDLDEDGELVSIVVGLNYISTDPPERARLVGVVHQDGQEACDAWCAKNEGELRRLFGDRYVA